MPKGRGFLLRRTLPTKNQVLHALRKRKFPQCPAVFDYRYVKKLILTLHLKC